MQHYIVQHHVCCFLEFNLFAVHSSKGLLAAQSTGLPCCLATKLRKNMRRKEKSKLVSTMLMCRPAWTKCLEACITQLHHCLAQQEMNPCQCENLAVPFGPVIIKEMVAYSGSLCYVQPNTSLLHSALKSKGSFGSSFDGHFLFHRAVHLWNPSLELIQAMNQRLLKLGRKLWMCAGLVAVYISRSGA
jgi:hypothetical protein